MDESLPDELKFWLALVRMPGIGGAGIRRLLDCLSLAEIFSASRSQLAALGVNERLTDILLNPPWALVDQDLAWLQEPGNHALTLDSDEYPAQLKEISSPPPVLFVKGRLDVLRTPQIGMVGSRNPSVSGIKIATDFAGALARAGFTVTSGMALGIDAASHQGAIDVDGLTIAVTGTGLDRVYPAKHKRLAADIVAHGALVSEFPPGTVAKPDHFPRRNRIISGLCRGLLVVEAAQQSGSLITARLALDQGREVFAIPGSIHNPLARGCNALIRQGAKLVETVEDIFEELGQYNQTDIEPKHEFPASALDLEQQNLLNLIPYSPVTVDTLVQDSGYSVEAVSSMLLVLELQGYVAAAPGSSYYRI